MEQLSRNCHLTYCKTISNFNIPIIDYSEINNNFIKNSVLLRYQYCPEEISKLSCSAASDKIYDIAFVGSLSSRRAKILTELRKSGYQVNVVKGWQKERDQEIIKSKILLNIHYAEDYTIYEAIRCDRFLFSGMIVVTETSISQDSIDINNLLIIEDYHNLVSKVKDVIKNYPSYLESLKLEREQTLPSIIISRKQDLVQVEKMLVDFSK